MTLKDLPELVNANVISEDVADRIRAYYRDKYGHSSQNKLYIVTGILGAILTGLGIILIIAHNSDELSRFSKTVFAFLPLVTGQVLCGFTLFKRWESTAWREAASSFLFFAVGAGISLVAQIYNIPGGTGTFMLTWMLLSFPIIYIMQSSVASLLYLAGITYYACVTNYWTNSGNTYYYWLLLLLALPNYYWLYKNKPRSNFMTFHNWIVPLSLTITLGTLAQGNYEVMFIAYISLFGFFYMTGNTLFFRSRPAGSQGYTTIGTLGTISVLMGLSFDWFWSGLRSENIQFTTTQIIAAIIPSICAVILLYLQKQNKNWSDIKPVEPVFIAFIIIFGIGIISAIAVILINLLVLSLGLLIIRNGARMDHLGVLNFGLLVIALLVVCRFFDTDLSFVIRGLLFLGVGIGFFVANFRMIKKRKANA